MLMVRLCTAFLSTALGSIFLTSIAAAISGMHRSRLTAMRADLFFGKNVSLLKSLRSFHCNIIGYTNIQVYYTIFCRIRQYLFKYLPPETKTPYAKLRNRRKFAKIPCRRSKAAHKRTRCAENTPQINLRCPCFAQKARNAKSRTA